MSSPRRRSRSSWARVGASGRRRLWKLIGLGALTPRSRRARWTASRARSSLAAARASASISGGGLGDVAALPLLGLLLSAISLALSPIQNAISRGLIEHPADRYALELTRDPAAFIGAMEKLGRLNLADPQPPALVKWLLYSHPTLQERIDYGRSWRAED